MTVSKDLERLRKAQDGVKSVRLSDNKKPKAGFVKKGLGSNPIVNGKIVPEDYVQTYPDGTKLYKINSFIKDIAKTIKE